MKTIVDAEATGKFLRELRLKNELSVNDLCDKFGLTHMSIRKWEKGLSLPSIESLIQLSGLYNLPLEQLVIRKAMDVTNSEDNDKEKEN